MLSEILYVLLAVLFLYLYIPDERTIFPQNMLHVPTQVICLVLNRDSDDGLPFSSN
jgi:hypothetical protein